MLFLLLAIRLGKSCYVVTDVIKQPSKCHVTRGGCEDAEHRKVGINFSIGSRRFTFQVIGKEVKFRQHSWLLGNMSYRF